MNISSRYTASAIPEGRDADTGMFRSRKWEVPAGGIGASIAESDFGTAPAVVRTLHLAVNENFLTYLPEKLGREAEAACGEFLRHRFGWAVAHERIHLVPDVIAGFAAVATLYSSPGSPIIVPTPCYMPFLTEPRRLGRPVIEVPMLRDADRRWVMDLEALDAAFRAGGELLVLCNPHNPLGQVMTRAEQAEVCAVVSRHGGRVFEDAIHAPVVYPGHRYLPYAQLSDEAARQVVTATATSKGWNIPGLKAAELILTNDADQELWERTDPFPYLRGSTLGAVAAIAAYRDSLDWLDATVSRLAENRDPVQDWIRKSLPEADFVPPEATYLAWIGLAGCLHAADPASQLEERAKLSLTAGRDCGAGFESFVRFNFALKPATLEEALRRFVGAAR